MKAVLCLTTVLMCYLHCAESVHHNNGEEPQWPLVSHGRVRPNNADDTKWVMDFAREFKDIFGKELADIRRLSLSDEGVSFTERHWYVGTFTLERGWLPLNITLVVVNAENKVQSDGQKVTVDFDVPEIHVIYRFNLTFKLLGSVTGSVNVLLKDQRMKAVFIGKKGPKKCDITFGLIDFIVKYDNYDIVFRIDNPGVLGKSVMYAGQKIITAFVKDRMFDKVKNTMKMKLKDVLLRAVEKTQSKFEKWGLKHLCQY